MTQQTFEQPETHVSNLLPCPFCGTEPIWVNNVNDNHHPGIKCTHCQFTISEDRTDKTIGFWNRRSASTVEVQPAKEQELSELVIKSIGAPSVDDSNPIDPSELKSNVKQREETLSYIRDIMERNNMREPGEIFMYWQKKRNKLNVLLPAKEHGVTDKEMLDWLQDVMTNDDNYCEVYLAGLRNGTGKATAFQTEGNPQKFETVNAPTLRESIALAMGKQTKE